MTMLEDSELQKRVARYEAAVNELRVAHHDVQDVLVEHVLYERWQQIGAELGFTAAQAHPEGASQQDLHSMNQQIPQMAEPWAG